MNEQFQFSRRTLMAGASLLATGLVTGAAVGETTASDLDLSGKSILITGASSGFGRVGAEYYARRGAKVFATMRNLPRTEGDELEALAATEGLDITVLEIDVTSDEQVEAGVSAALAATEGKIDVLINNAGIAIGGPIEVQDMEATHLMFDTNVYGPQRMIRALLPNMRAAGGGQVFNVTSQLGRVILPGYAQYSPTKFALEALSEQLAYETVSQGIEVTIIQPGGYPTKIWENQIKLTSALKDRTPESLLSAYPQLSALMGEIPTGAGGDTDPADIPKAIAEVIAMPKGTRPLRKAVHPTFKLSTIVNEASAKAQLMMLGNSPFGRQVRSVLD